MTEEVATIPARVLDVSVEGSQLREPLTLRGQVPPAGAVVLAFVRHLGCLFAREMTKDVRVAFDTAGVGPRNVVFVHMGTPDEGRAFFDAYWPGVANVSDPSKRLYDAFGLERGTFAQMFGPRVWACGLRAVTRGHFVGKPVGDPWTMPGLFVVHADAGGEAQIVWRHTFRHAGDHPTPDALASAVGLTARRPLSAA